MLSQAMNSLGPELKSATRTNYLFSLSKNNVHHKGLYLNDSGLVRLGVPPCYSYSVTLSDCWVQ